MTTSQSLIQDQLQRKHIELQTIIENQQDELRRVSEQLVMARFGIPVVNVTLPYSTDNSSIVRGARSIDNLPVYVTAMHPPTSPTPSHLTASPSGDERLSYMQLTPVSSVHIQHHHPHLLLRDEFTDASPQQLGGNVMQASSSSMEMMSYGLSDEHDPMLYINPSSSQWTT